MGGYIEHKQKDVGGGVMKWFDRPVTDPNITMVVELSKIIIYSYQKNYVYHTQIK